MKQEHYLDLGKGGEAKLIIDDPLLKFWKRASFFYDLSKCKKGYISLALKDLTKLALGKLRKREVSIHIHFPDLA
jgi:hypothetical protein